MDFIEIEILNWEKYNPRKDYTKPWWFALSNTITSDDEFCEFSDAEFRAWIHILCTASVQKSNRPRLFFKAVKRATGIEKKALLGAVDKLKILKTIQVPDRICTDPVRDPFGTITEQNNTRTIQNNNAHAEAFAVFWDGYPRKVGKGKAESAYRKALASGATSEMLLATRDAYVGLCRREGTEAKYIKHAATLLNSWQDGLDPDYGQSESFQKTKQSSYEETLAVIEEIERKEREQQNAG